MRITAASANGIAALACILVLGSCEKLWSGLDNPVDEKAENYQGYPSVANPSEAKPAEPEAGIVAYTPVLVATKVVGAEAYQFQIDFAPDFASPLYTGPEWPSNEFVPADCPGLSAATTYYWRFRVKKAGSWNPYTASLASFGLTATATGAVEPANAGSTSDTTPLLDWEDVPSASGYELQIADSSGGVPAAAALSASTSRHQMQSGLSVGAWYWRVRAKNAANSWGAWSSVRSFTVTWDYPWGSPTPADAGKTSDATPLLDWDDVTNAVGYEIQIADTRSEVSNAAAVATTASGYQFATSLSLGDLRYWRVRPRDAAGAWGPWSSVWSFAVTLDMVPILGGGFSMGSDAEGDADEKPAHDLRISSFRLSRHEITQSQYQAAMGANPSNFRGDFTASFPVDRVGWFDALEFCNALSRIEGLQSVYALENVVRATADGITYISSASVSVDWSKDGYRLPTEAEWEYAARGGANSAHYPYPGSNTLEDVAWVDTNAGTTTHAVGTRAANELGIYDMAGNVYEWCWDWWDNAYYGSSPAVDPRGPDSASGFRVRRGGAWLQNYTVCRTWDRAQANPDYANFVVGLRVARSEPAYVYSLNPTPSNAGTTSDTTPLLEWSGAEGALEYAVQIADSVSSLASAATVFATSSDYQYPAVLNVGDVRYWRVRARNAERVWGEWSSAWSFAIVAP